MRLANAQPLEPDTDGVFYALGHDPDRWIALERQTATIHTSAKWVGIGATAKSISEFKPGKSPVRVSSGVNEFIVHSVRQVNGRFEDVLRSSFAHY